MHGTLAKNFRSSRRFPERPSRAGGRAGGSHPDLLGRGGSGRGGARRYAGPRDAAYAEWFEGYQQDPAEILQRTFREVGGYDDIVVLRDIPFDSCCEHHIDVQLSATSSTDTVALQ